MAKSRGRHIAKILLLTVFVLPTAWLLVQQIGPRAKPLEQDPIETLNAERTGAGADTAELYAKAWDLLIEPDVKDWDDECGRHSTPLPAELAEWVASQADAIECLRGAIERPECYFPLRRGPEGLVVQQHTTHFRRFARFLSLRARLAADRRDASLLADSLELMNGMARDVFEQPTLVEHLVGCAITALALDHVAVPFEWEECSDAVLDDYSRRIACWFAPLPPLTEAIEMECWEACWMVQTNLGGHARYVLSPARIHGELNRQYAPYVELAGQPVEVQFAPDNPVLEQITRADQASIHPLMGLLNLPRFISQLAAPGLRRAFELNDRCVAMQRGYEALTAVFAFHRTNGRWPETLDELGDRLPPDPYTASPFIYRRTDDGFTLYSAGLDRDDDGGRHDERFGEKRAAAGKERPPPDGDYVFWPLPEAAQAGSAGG